MKTFLMVALGTWLLALGCIVRGLTRPCRRCGHARWWHDSGPDGYPCVGSAPRWCGCGKFQR